jgi:protein-disulfide isomerase
LDEHIEHEQEEQIEEPIDELDKEMDEELDEPIEEQEEAPRPALVITVQTWATPIVAIVMLVIGLVGGYLLYPEVSSRIAKPTPVAAVPTTGAQSSTAGNQPDQASREEMMEFLISQTRHFKGNPDAEVTIIEFSDFQWPFCGRFAADAGRQIEEQYIENDQVRFGYWHFAFLGPESAWAAEASECAGEQDAFWDYHDLIFESQAGENQGAFSKENLKQMAVDMGLDSATFDECLDSGKFTEQVQLETQTARQLGVTSTPAFVINGVAVMGAQPFAVFEQAIETELGN